jgi:5'-nucleotidase (lipoprotein e(P4) family)
VLLKTGSSVKDERRSKVRQSHEVALLIGDNLSDFSGIFDNRQDGADLGNVMANRDMFGYEFIILPNPLYGGWEKSFRGESAEATNQNKRDALRVYKR